MIAGRVLDATALIDAATGGTISTRAFVHTAVQMGIVLAVPATALQDAWARLPTGDRPFLDLVLDLPVTVIDDLTAAGARHAGLAGRHARGGHDDTTAAHVVHCALTRHWPVLTADPEPLQAIDPEVLIERLPRH